MKDGFHQERRQQRLSHVELLLNRPASTKNHHHHRQGLSLDNLQLEGPALVLKHALCSSLAAPLARVQEMALQVLDDA